MADFVFELLDKTKPLALSGTVRRMGFYFKYEKN